MITGFVKFLNFKVELLPVVNYFLRDIPSSFSNCGSKLINNFGMRSFYNKIRNASNYKICKFMPINSIGVTNLISRFWPSLIIRSAKVFNKPFHEFFVGIYNRQSKRVIVMLAAKLFACSLQINTNTTFAVYNSSEITQLFCGPHDDPFYVTSVSTDILYHKIKYNALNDLSGRTPRGEAKVLSASKDAEENPKWFSRQIENIWSLKSKRMLYVAINEQVSLQNQDPKPIFKYGVFKLSLIDLEAEA